MLISPGILGEVMPPRFLVRSHGYRYDGSAALLIAERLAHFMRRPPEVSNPILQDRKRNVSAIS